MKYSLEKIQERLKRTPKEIKRVIGSTELSDALSSIINNHRLHIDKAGILGEEINLVLLGLTHPDNFVKNLRLRLGVSNETVEAVAQDVNEKIFKEIRESLKALHTGEEDESSIKRDEVLREVEEPTRVKPTMPVAGDMESPQKREAVKEIAPPPPQVPKTTLVEPASPPVEDNMAEKTDITKEEVTVPDTEEKEETSKDSYTGADPYLEPIE